MFKTCIVLINYILLPSIINAQCESESLEKDLTNGKFYDIFDNHSISQDDPTILKYIRDFHLRLPSGKPYLYKKRSRPSYSAYVSNLFKNKENGFYVEAGAHDGECRSNTLELEKRNWNGLLIEPDPIPLAKLYKRKRNAWISDLCLSLNGYPEKANFLHPTSRKINGHGILEKTKQTFALPGNKGSKWLKHYIDVGAVQCFPLYSILSTLNITVIDYFSLDVKGSDFKVLQQIPWDKLSIKVMTVEHEWIPEGYDALITFLATKNFKPLYKNFRDVFVVRNDFFNEINLDSTLHKGLSW